MGPFKKYVICIMAFFAQFDFNTLLLPLCYSLNFTKKLKIFCMYGCYSVSRSPQIQDVNSTSYVRSIYVLRLRGYIKEGRKSDTQIKFNFQTHGAYKQTTLAKQWHNIVVQISYSYFRYTGRLFLRCAVFVALCNIIRAL